MMKNAEAQLPSAKSQIVARCTRLESRSQPKIQRPEERRLEHECREAFDREWRAEDVADELRVDRPVHPELELLHEPGRDADREVDQHERPEEAGETQPGLVAPAVPERLHDRDERREAERQRDEQEVVERGRRELDPSEVDGGDRGIRRLRELVRDHVVVRVASDHCSPPGPALSSASSTQPEPHCQYVIRSAKAEPVVVRR